MASIDNPFSSDEVVGVIARDRLDAAVAAAESAGFVTESMSGQKDASMVDVDGDSGLSKILRFFQEGEEKDALRVYHDRLVEGDAVLRLLEVGDRAEEAGELLAAHQADTVWHYGKWTYKPLHETSGETGPA